MFRSNFVKNCLIIVSVLFFIGILLYVIGSMELIFQKSSDGLTIAFNLIILVIEIITAIYGVFLLLHTALVFIKNDINKFHGKLNSQPLVSLIIPTFNPNIFAIETNLYNLMNMSYKNIEIFITDNSDNKETISQLESLSKKFQINFVHRDGLQGFKAKNLNDVLKRINGKYFIIVDIDQSLKDQAIEKFLYQFELSNNNKLAFIQGRFEIQNASNIIRTSIAILYTFFYDVISIAKSHRKTVLFNGSSACFRTEIIKEVGGFPENCFTEDIAISYVLILNGYQSIYLNETVTTALVPWKLSTLLSSFWRWSHGGTSCLLLYGNQILKSKKISFDTKIELWMNTISFIAISGILIVIYSMLCMYWLEIKILRPELSLNTFVLPLYLIFPIFTSFNHLINCVIGMWESKTLKRILYLIPYSIASLAISIFIILPTYYALLKIKGPNSNQSKWNRSFNIPKTITYLLCNLIVFFASFYHALIRGDLFLVSFATMALILFSTILFLIKDYFINPSKEEKIYFTNYRIKKNFPLE